MDSEIKLKSICTGAVTVVSRCASALFVFLSVHVTFWLVEWLHYSYCVKDFWMSILTTHSTPCMVLRDVSGIARSASANLIALGIGVFAATVAPFKK